MRPLTLQDLFANLAGSINSNSDTSASFEIIDNFVNDGETLIISDTATAPTVTTGTNYPVNILGDYPVAYWRLAEAAATGTAYDSNQDLFSLYPRIASTSLTTVTQGAASFLSHSSSAQLTASGSAIAFPNGSSLQITTSFSLEMWINFSSFGTNGTSYSLLAKQAGGSGGSTGEYELYAHSNGTSLTLNFRQNNGFTTLNATTNLTSTGVWYHVALVRDSVNNATTIYVNGVTAGSTTYTAATTTTANVTIGASGTFSTLACSVTEVALYAKALTATQVAARYAWGTATDAQATAYGGAATLYGVFPYPSLGAPTAGAYGASSSTWGSFTWK